MICITKKIKAKYTTLSDQPIYQQWALIQLLIANYSLWFNTWLLLFIQVKQAMFYSDNKIITLVGVKVVCISVTLWKSYIAVIEYETVVLAPYHTRAHFCEFTDYECSVKCTVTDVITRHDEESTNRT